MLTADRLRELLQYDPATGHFRWRVQRNSFGGKTKIGATAGQLNQGRIQIGLDGKRYLAHRLAWLYMTGAWPTLQIDHRDCDPLNNRWANLREATQSQNNANRRPRGKLGFKGVSRNGNHGYFARIRVNGEEIYLGNFRTAVEAARVYAFAARDLHGEFART